MSRKASKPIEPTEPEGFDYKKYLKRYRESHPDKALQWRINAAINLLELNGYVVYAVRTADED